jgi:D-alanyl-D-alanine carboxypeptidase
LSLCHTLGARKVVQRLRGLFSVGLVLAAGLIGFGGMSWAKPVYTALVMDADSGKVVAGVNERIHVPTASLTKMMTLYLIFERLEQGLWDLDTLLRVSLHASSQPATKWGLRAGQKVSVREAIVALAARSANDMASVIRESVPKCIERMNATAATLGMAHSRFCTTSGWDRKGQYSCAYDMGILLRALWKRFPQYRSFLGLSKIKKGDAKLTNTNKLQGVVPGMIMGKTGYTSTAGYCLATLVQRGQSSFVFVVMGMPSGIQRNKHMQQMIHTAYQTPIGLETLLRSRGSAMTAKAASDAHAGQPHQELSAQIVRECKQLRKRKRKRQQVARAMRQCS